MPRAVGGVGVSYELRAASYEPSYACPPARLSAPSPSVSLRLPPSSSRLPRSFSVPRVSCPPSGFWNTRELDLDPIPADEVRREVGWAMPYKTLETRPETPPLGRTTLQPRGIQAIRKFLRPDSRICPILAF